MVWFDTKFNQAQCSEKLIRAIANTKRVETHRETVVHGFILEYQFGQKPTGMERSSSSGCGGSKCQNCPDGLWWTLFTRHTSEVRRVEEMKHTPLLEGIPVTVSQAKLATINLKVVADWSAEDGIEVELPIPMSDKEITHF